MHAESSSVTVGAACRRQWVLVLAIPAVVAIAVVGAVGAAPLAGQLLTVLLGVLALLRAVLPVRAVGALAVRTRMLDVGVLLVLAIGLGVLSTSPNL